MNNAPDIVISLYKDELKVKEYCFNFDEIINFDLLVKLEDSFSYTILNEGCDLITLFFDKDSINIKQGEMLEINDIKEIGSSPLYRAEVKKEEIIKNVVLELIDDSHINSELHLALRSMVLSINHFDNVKIFEGKVKLNDLYFNNEKAKLDIIKKSNENINSLLFALGELRNNLSFITKKELIKKKDLLAKDPTFDFEHSGYIILDDEFALGKIKNYCTPENILLVKALNNLKGSLGNLKSLVSIFIKRMNSEIISYNALIKSDKKKNISKTNSVKIVALYKSKKLLITDLNQLLQRLFVNIKMILDELEASCLNKEYDFTSLVLSKNKYYKKVFDILSNQLSFNVDFDFLQIALAHSHEKFMLNDLVSFYGVVAFDKVLNEFGYKTNTLVGDVPKKIDDSVYLYKGTKYLISLEYFKFKKKPRNKEETNELKVSFVIKLLSNEKEVLKTMAVDSYSKILDNNLVDKSYKDEFMALENNDKNIYFDGALVNEYIFLILKNPNKFRTDYTYRFKNCSNYILSLYKIFKIYLSKFLDESLSLDDASMFIEM